ncbi:sensor histidine kinase [Texcoconibacillus texcoconensis]|uniref:histidine kinase n=1 Tax=Texcoconibacillus texcoconensis TaxID=1095777 RepID=A0A840QRS7_9BACI|nr:HAMP domain-containing sensor histidine kinase [Texcoconibacillus texcoconensis]MBB5174049.1 two-component system sensor histidine kinase BaeS [Texcoconibacillus texcoconensis]
MFKKNPLPWKKTGMLWRLAGTNILLMTTLVIISSLIIYNTACYLVEQIPNVDESTQTSFNETLYTYLLWMSPLVILIGSVLHFSMIKKMLNPVRKLASSTKVLKNGQYPSPIDIEQDDEIGELTHNFNELIDRLKENEHIRNKMLGDMAHELRTPLSNINGYLEGLKNEVIVGSPSLYDSLHKESERVIQMINQLNELDEWNDCVKSNEKKNARIDQVLTHCMNLFNFEFEKRNIIYDICVDEATLFIDEKEVHQAMMNLIQNSIQYYDGTGEILLHGKKRQGDYFISVTGPGEPIPEEEREWLFERFYKVDRSRQRKTEGTGLGLSIVKEIIVGTHNGNVGIETHENQHTFWMTIPYFSKKS